MSSSVRERRIDNPQTGEHITFVTTAGDSGGELLRMEVIMDPGGFVAGEHVHPNQEERFEILEGSVRMRIDGIEREATTGDVIVVPRGSSHVWWNPTDTPARVLADLRPALRTQELREVLFAWTKAGKTRDGMPANPLRLAVLAREYCHEVQATDGFISRLPRPVRNILLGILATTGRLLGITATTSTRT
jgi:quercetin dioxygenase-like cupin family protein